MNAVYFGRAVHVARAERGLSRYDLRDLSGVSYPYIAEIEKGTKLPSMRIVDSLASALRMPSSDLLASAESLERFAEDWVQARHDRVQSTLDRIDRTIVCFD